MGVLLKFARFKDFVTWDVKSHLLSLISSQYNVVDLGKYIHEETIKIKPFNYPNDDFKILGVSNKVGLFDNEIKKGKDINQAYKIVKNGFLAYNPYRINVGSIGLKTKEQKNDLISPAYVVFSCKKELLPEYLFLIFKTKTFNKIINESTKGSVRQILSFDILEKLKIPLPPLDIQKKLVEQVNQYEKELKNLKFEFDKLLKQFNKNIFLEVDQDDSLLKFINFKQLHNWSVQNLSENNFNYNQKYNLVKISSFLKRDKTLINIDDDTTYKRVTIRTKNQGVSIRDTEIGKNIGTKKQYIIKKGQFLLSKIDARNGAFGIATDELNGAIITADFFAYNIDKTKIEPYFLSLITTTKQFIQFAQNSSTGTTNRQRLNEELFLNVEIPLPTLDEQNELIRDLQNNSSKQDTAIQNKTLALQEFEREIFNET